jgi:hypothetical protein
MVVVHTVRTAAATRDPELGAAVLEVLEQPGCVLRQRGTAGIRRPRHDFGAAGGRVHSRWVSEDAAMTRIATHSSSPVIQVNRKQR